ncbi:MAG TPA: DnaJ C-terminal domain-containing protein [Vicinamibacterales bacterium]
MEFKDYYQTLGLTKTATEKEIKQAYRKLARKFHPDVNPGDKASEAKFKEINEAYEVLGDPDKRRKYDELGANWRLYEQAQQQGYAGGSPFGGGGPFGGGAWNINVGGGQGSYRTMTPEEMQEMFGDADPFSDFFKTFFGGAGPQREGRGRGRAPRAQKGRDLEYEVELTLEEAFHGATRRVPIKHGGHARSVDVRIPPGVKDGSRVRAAGEGEGGSNGGPAGDLYLRVRVRPHALFERDGNDLRTKIAVPVSTAVLGGEANVPTISGSVRLRIPETTQNGQVFRLKGHGMPAAGKPDHRGDLYAAVDIQLPRSLTREQRQHYEALQKLEREIG